MPVHLLTGDLLESMEETRYSVEIKGRMFGPFGKRRLQEFIDRKQIEPDTPLISKQGYKVRASTIPGLVFPVRQALDGGPDLDLVRRFTSEPKQYPRAPLPPALSPAAPEEQRWYADENDPETTAILKEEAPAPTATFMEKEEPAALLTQEDPEPTAILTEVEPQPTTILSQEDPEPTSLDMVQQQSPEGEDETVTQAVNYDDLEAKFAAAEAAREGSLSRVENDVEGPTGALSPAETVHSPPTTTDGTTQCPYCEEPIKIGARKCKWCREWLPETGGDVGGGVPVEAPPPQPSAPAAASSLTSPGESGVQSLGKPSPVEAEVTSEDPRYTCPSCRATSPKIRYVDYQKLVHCTTCGFKTAPNFESAPPPSVLDTPACSLCGNPTRWLVDHNAYYCPLCRIHPGGSPDSAPPHSNVQMGGPPSYSPASWSAPVFSRGRDEKLTVKNWITIGVLSTVGLVVVISLISFLDEEKSRTPTTSSSDSSSGAKDTVPAQSSPTPESRCFESLSRAACKELMKTYAKSKTTFGDFCRVVIHVCEKIDGSTCYLAGEIFLNFKKPDLKRVRKYWAKACLYYRKMRTRSALDQKVMEGTCLGALKLGWKPN